MVHISIMQMISIRHLQYVYNYTYERTVSAIVTDGNEIIIIVWRTLELDKLGGGGGGGFDPWSSSRCIEAHVRSAYI